jgi:transcriptional regulator of heat shock response
MLARRFEILEAAIRDFIETGEPVSSSRLFERYDFGIRPAMIRAELSCLEEEGYLEQPYHSSGRVPSNRGYEFFAERVLEAKKPQAAENMQDLLFEGDFDKFLHRLSTELGIAGALGMGNRFVKKEGLESLMEHVSWGPREEVLQVIRDFEALDRRLARLENLFEDNFLEAYIGKKSPVTKSDELAVIAGDYETEEGRVFLFAIGPKRMNYDKAAALFKGLKAFHKNNH